MSLKILKKKLNFVLAFTLKDHDGIQGGDYVPVRPFEAVNEAVTEGFF